MFWRWIQRSSGSWRSRTLHTEGFFHTYASQVFCTSPQFLTEFDNRRFLRRFIILQKKEAIALHHYESTPGQPRPDKNEVDEAYDSVDSLETSSTTITENAVSHENAGFDHSQGQDKRAPAKPGERRDVSNPVDKKAGKRNSKGKGRRVRFDLRGPSKEKKAERRAAAAKRNNIPDIIVISEEAGGSLGLDENEKKRGDDKRDGDNDEDMPADLSSIFEESKKMSKGVDDPSHSPATVSAVSDDEGTVVVIW